MALSITNGFNGTNLQLASGVYADIPAFNSGFSDNFEIQFYGTAADLTSILVIVGRSVSGSNDPRIQLDTSSGLIRARNTSVERTASFTGIDYTNEEGFQLRVWRSSGSLNFRMQELTATDLSNMASNSNGLPNFTGMNPDGGGSANYQFGGSFNGEFIVDRAFDSAAIANANFGSAVIVRIIKGATDLIYNFSRTSGTVVPETNGGTAGTLVGATKTYAPIYTFGDNITFTTALTGLTGVYIEDSQGNQFDLTGVTDTDADIPALSAGLDACLLEQGTLTVTDGVSTETANVELLAPAGYTTTTLGSLPPVELQTNWTFGFDTAAAIGDQSFENNAEITHNTNGTISWTPQELSYIYYTIDASSGVISEITKSFNAEGGLVTSASGFGIFQFLPEFN